MVEKNLRDWYSNQVVLLTGATGFMGKCITEKLLSTTNVPKIYMLIRPKKGKPVQERFHEIFQDPLFELSKKESQFENRVKMVAGDVSLPELGLSKAIKNQLINEVTVVIHGAATVRFDEKLKIAIAINVQGTKNMILFCKEMKELQAMIHVSTAYANCIYKHIDEKFYDPPIKADKLLQLADCLNDKQLENITPIIISRWPNTYSFTKAVAEDVIKTYGQNLPIAVFRPTIVISSYDKGWLDNIYGPASLVMATGTGVLRANLVDRNATADMVPVDYCSNALLAAVKYVATNRPSEIPIFNYCSSQDNQLDWGGFMEITYKYGNKFPTEHTFWFPIVHTTRHKSVYRISSLFYHIIPALFVDTCLLLRNRKPRALKVYGKIHKFVYLLSYFSTKSWTFNNFNVKTLLKQQTEDDKTYFYFDMSDLNWDSCLKNYIIGVKKYLLKEDEKRLSYARRKRLGLYCLHYGVIYSLYGILLWMLWQIFLSPVLHLI